MKLKKKLFSVLGASAVTLAAITTVVACAKNNGGGGGQEEQEQEGLDIGVSYTGTTKKFVIGGNDTELTIEGFSITQPVLGGQEMRVTSTNPDVEVEAPIRPADVFSVKITLLNTPEAFDKDYNFDLIFSFAEHGAKVTSKRIGGFKVKYYVSWQYPNKLDWKEGYSQAFVFNESQRQIKTTNLILDRKLQSQETIEITKVTNDKGASADITFGFIQHDIVDDTTLPVTIIVNATEDQIDEANPEHFTIHYKIVYGGEVQVEDGTVSGFSIQLRKQWVSPAITATGFDTEGATNFVTEQGALGYYFNSYQESQSASHSRYFILNRPLGEDDEIKVFCDNNNVEVTSTISQDDVGGNPYIDLDFKFDYTFDPYVAQNQVFSIAFVFYFRGEQKGYQNIPYTFKLTYTPYVDPDPIEYNYAITFNPVEMDTRGTGWMEVTGKIVRQNEDGTVTPGLSEGDYMTIGNNSQEPPEDWSEDNLSNQFEFTEYSGYNPEHQAGEYVFYEWESIPYTAEFGENGEFTFLVDYEPVMEQFDEPVTINQIIECPSQIVTRFYKGDPCDDETEHELIDTSISMITFKHYPVGFWQQNSTEATDQWIKDRSFELAFSYNEIPNDESTRKVVSANTWLVNSYASEMSPVDELLGHWLYLATSSDAVKTFKQLFSSEDFLREHNAMFGMADPNSARKYLVNDSSEYLTQNDFLYLPLNLWDVPEEIREQEGLYFDNLIKFEDSSLLTWNSEVPDETNFVGSDIGIINFAAPAIWSSFPLMTEDQEENNMLLLYKYFIGKFSLLSKWKEETGQYTDVYEEAAIKSWNNWACAVCSGFVPTTITLKGEQQPAFKWVTHDIQFGSDNLPEYKTFDESKAQNFGDLDDIDGGVVKHAAPAYRLADEYNATSIDGGWFPGDLGGSMFVVREWNEYGVSLNTPQVVGINWNGGQQGLSGENMITPWIDLLSDDIDGDGTPRSILENYLHPIV